MTPGDFIARWRASELKERSDGRLLTYGSCRFFRIRYRHHPSLPATQRQRPESKEGINGRSNPDRA